MVASITMGNKLRRQNLVRQAERNYGDLLRSLHCALSESETANTPQTLMTAVLLGLYEVRISISNSTGVLFSRMVQIIAASSSNTGQHVVHVAGVCSLISRPDCPFKLEGGMQLFQLGNALLLPENQQRAGVLCAPASHSSVRALDAVLVDFNPVFHRADEILSNTSARAEDVEKLMSDAQRLENEFAAWQAERVGEWRPTTLAHSQLPELRRLTNLQREFSSYYDRIYSLYSSSKFKNSDTL